MVKTEVYNSVSTISVYKNGKGKTKIQRVRIRDGKGFKEIVHRQNGRVTHKTRKALNKKELGAIQTCKFKPGLFRDCVPTPVTNSL